MSKAVATHLTRAQSRLISVLQDNLAAELSAIQDTDLHLPAPSASSYFVFYNEAEALRAAENHAVSVFVFPSAPTDYGFPRSSTTNQYTATASTRMDVMIQFLPAPQTQITSPYTGESITSREIDLLRAERYRGAVLNCACKYALGTDDIIRIDPVSGGSIVDYDPESDRVLGYSKQTFDVLQEVVIPTRQ